MSEQMDALMGDAGTKALQMDEDAAELVRRYMYGVWDALECVGSYRDVADNLLKELYDAGYVIKKG